MADETEGEPTEPAATETERPRADIGSAMGAPGQSGAEATDVRVETADVGAGTGVTARDAGEEGEPAGLDATGAGTSELSDDSSQWAAIGGSAMTKEGAAGGALRDEEADETEPGS